MTKNVETKDEEDEFSELDDGIREYVRVLVENGIQTYESCEGGPWKNGKGHAYLEPTIRFFGEFPEGFKALSIALYHDLPVDTLRRFWNIIDGEPVGPDWEMTFTEKAPKKLSGRTFPYHEKEK